jgi:hydroxymethylglutaryl-CoA synthase
VLPNVGRNVARQLGLPDTSVRDNLSAGCGDTGAAHPLLMLASALEHADPGAKVLVVGFGQGGDALLFETTDAITAYNNSHAGPSRWLARRKPCTYSRYLVLNNMLKIGRGIRAEVDKGSALTAAYRHRDLLTGLVGGRCTTCETHQIPRSRICANPDCSAFDSQVPHSFAESFGHVLSFTADNLTYTPDPPAIYGMIDFAEGGRLMMDFTNVSKEELHVGAPMRMVFRVKDHDSMRSFSRYFWKAAPAQTEVPARG